MDFRHEAFLYSIAKSFKQSGIYFVTDPQGTWKQKPPQKDFGKCGADGLFAHHLGSFLVDVAVTHQPFTFLHRDDHPRDQLCRRFAEKRREYAPFINENKQFQMIPIVTSTFGVLLDESETLLKQFLSSSMLKMLCTYASFSLLRSAALGLHLLKARSNNPDTRQK